MYQYCNQDKQIMVKKFMQLQSRGVNCELGPVLYKMQKSKRAQPKIVYVDKLKAFDGETPEGWELETWPVKPEVEKKDEFTRPVQRLTL